MPFDSATGWDTGLGHFQEAEPWSASKGEGNIVTFHERVGQAVLLWAPLHWWQGWTEGTPCLHSRSHIEGPGSVEEPGLWFCTPSHFPPNLHLVWLGGTDKSLYELHDLKELTLSQRDSFFSSYHTILSHGNCNDYCKTQICCHI